MRFRVMARSQTMTRSHPFPGFRTIVLTAALAMPAGLALAGETGISAEQIVNALKAKPLTRSLSTAPKDDDAAKAREVGFLDSVRNRKTRSLSLAERDEIAEIASVKPKIDLEIQFDYNSADISKASMPSVHALGKALTDPSLKGSTFVVAGHTDAVGSEPFNQELSERRADSIKRYLVEKFGIAGSDLVAVGYGKSRLKDAANPTDAANRRVQVVNTEVKSASK
jgi:outer membrane protein OmpA-like peptidoglycan-associated protein